MAIAAHPDDIEFMMAGTLTLLHTIGYDIHYMTLSNGSCGSLKYDAEKTAEIRIRESREAAGILNARYHEPICSDFEILYEVKILRQLAEVVRTVKPRIILTHSPSDYMEDHTNTCRLTVTGAFVRSIPNFTAGDVSAADFDCTLYHAMPHGLRDPLRRRVIPGIFIDTTSVQDIKRNALKAHKSQQEWLDNSQKMNSFEKAMEDFSLEVGQLSKCFKHAEGWRRHLHYGFCSREDDPLQELESYYLINEEYERSLISEVIP